LHIAAIVAGLDRSNKERYDSAEDKAEHRGFHDRGQLLIKTPLQSRGRSCSEAITLTNSSLSTLTDINLPVSAVRWTNSNIYERDP
jgi:hypothetical protein